MSKSHASVCAFLVSALCAGAAVGCSANAAEPAGETTATEGEDIVGGSLASAYPEAATLNIDVTATSSYLCSAVLIAPRVVLTAGHCVDTHSKWEVHVGTETRTATSAATYDWAEKGAENVNPNHHDVGLVFLDQAITIATYPTIASAALANGSKVTDVGRVNSGTMTSSLYAATATVTGGASVGYPLDYTSTDLIQPGDSGGPDFSSGTHTIVAVNSGAGGSIEVLARVDLVRDWILSEIASHPVAVADAGAPPKDAGLAPITPPSLTKCPGTMEKESNNTYATANAMSAGATCGALTAGDQDWFAVGYAQGSLSIALATSGDATFALGQVAGSACTPSVTRLHSVTLAGAAAQTICVVVTSPTNAAQSYTLTVQH